MATCPACGQENPAGARFCNACAAPLAEARPAAREERKIVSVLFVDLVGFTARSERLDPEDVRGILRPYYARVRTEIEEFGGTVEKFIGDAVMAVFGAPIAHGDDPERAVRAALAVRSAVEELNTREPELELQIRIAVNTGEAIVAVGASADRGEGIVAGDVVNTASRLQGAAPTNGILAGEGTFRATRTLFEYREVEPFAVKGKSEPLRAWLALGARAAPGERVASTAPMLGRVHEVAALHRIFAGVVADRRPHLVTIVGDAGIGKTRLATEFTDQLEREGIRVLRGRSLPYGVSTLYGAFTQHVKQFAGIYASDDIEPGAAKLRTALVGLVGADAAVDLASHLELLIGLRTEGEVADRQILFLAARRFTEALAREQPTVLVFEDIHWADTGTHDLLETLASRIRDVPLMLVALARPDLLLSRPGWGGGMPAYTALPLETLGARDAHELADRLLGGTRLDIHGVVETAEGNPLFIEELVASVVERHEAAGRGLPTTIRELVSARLDALPASERTVLLDAAVVGKVFWRGALERLNGHVPDLSEVLDSLESRDLIRRESFSWIEREEQFTFKHMMIREVAYATLPRTRRRELHAAVAEFLEESTASSAATATALAQHWREAGEAERARRYVLLAADQAFMGWAKDEAAALYGQALELIDDSEPDLRREVARKRALAAASLIHIADARELARRQEPETSER
ncbi:MAG: AAA family ATPase [Gaiellaceae bacterium]